MTQLILQSHEFKKCVPDIYPTEHLPIQSQPQILQKKV